MDNDSLKKAIQEVLEDVKPGTIFDVHYVIERLFNEKNKQYLGNISEQAINQYDGTIANIIKGLGFERVEGDSISKNILGNYSPCSCWKK